MLMKYPIHVDENSPFPIENIPFGVFSTERNPKHRIGTIIGEYVVDLGLLASRDVFTGKGIDEHSASATGAVLMEPTLNAFASQGPGFCSAIRSSIINLLSDPKSSLFTDHEISRLAFVPAKETTMHLPMQIGGFTDFLCSEHHAQNCSVLTGQPIWPSFYAFPTAYNGRASSVVVTGTPVKRPRGMVAGPGTGTGYSFDTCSRLDFELEMGTFVSRPVPYGHTVTADEAAREHIFGFVLLNDWSARDIQSAEMQPLGPFNSKGTATTISPWVIMPDALGFARTGTSSTKAKEQMSLLPQHLQHPGESLFDVDLEVTFAGQDGTTNVLCKSNMRHLYWSPAQMLAHHSTSGCGLHTGDLLGTGTVSGPSHTDTVPTLGCLLELNEGAKKTISLSSGRKLTWLEDGDEVVLSGWAKGKGGKRIGFGEARGVVVPTA